MNEKPMSFQRRDKGLARRVGTSVEFDAKERRWVSTPIRIFVGPRKAARS